MSNLIPLDKLKQIERLQSLYDIIKNQQIKCYSSFNPDRSTTAYVHELINLAILKSLGEIN